MGTVYEMSGLKFCVFYLLSCSIGLYDSHFEFVCLASADQETLKDCNLSIPLDHTYLGFITGKVSSCSTLLCLSLPCWVKLSVLTLFIAVGELA